MITDKDFNHIIHMHLLNILDRYNCRLKVRVNFGNQKDVFVEHIKEFPQFYDHFMKSVTIENEFRKYDDYNPTPEQTYKFFAGEGRFILVEVFGQPLAEDIYKDLTKNLPKETTFEERYDLK